MSLKSLVIYIVRKIYLSLTIKLSSKTRLRISIINSYDKIRLIEFKIKSIIYKNLPSMDNIIYINPNRIIYEKDLTQNNWRLLLKFIKPLLNPKNNDPVQLINGNWDLKENLKLFKDDIKTISYYQHFINGMDWKDTPYYKREVKRYLEGQVRKKYKSIRELNLKFNYHDNLFEKIKSNGFKTQKKIIESNGFIINYGRGANIRKIDDDITVGIGRKGDIIFFDGRHRLNVAKLLKLKKIPVRVLVIHPELIKKLKK